MAVIGSLVLVWALCRIAALSDADPASNPEARALATLAHIHDVRAPRCRSHGGTSMEARR